MSTSRAVSPFDANIGYQHPFVDGTGFLFGVGDKPRTLREQAMSRFSAELRRRPEWWTARLDHDVRSAWKNEASGKLWQVGPASNNIEVELSSHQIDYVLDELSDYAERRDDSTGLQISCFERIWESFQIIPHDLLALLQTCLSFDVNPHRHSFIASRTIIACGSTRASPRNLLLSNHTVSKTFSAVPTDFSISADGSSVTALGYINNINPRLTETYKALEQTLGKIVPMFERVLSDLHRSNPLPQRIKGTYRYKIWDEPDPPDDSDDEELREQYFQEYRWWTLNRPIEYPDVPEEGFLFGLNKHFHMVELKSRLIQVVTRVKHFCLDTENPTLHPFTWHVEGMKNERIVACLHIVFVAENVTGSFNFRMAVTSPSHFYPYDVGATLRIWGLKDGDSCNQFLGSVPIQSGLCIAFPNIYQHRLADVQLQDPNKSGHLSVLSFLLVDPEVPPILSTSDVPPQQWTWVRDALEESLDKRLPSELVQKIVDEANFLLSDEEADRHQADMDLDRNIFTIMNTATYFRLPFDSSITR